MTAARAAGVLGVLGALWTALAVLDPAAARPAWPGLLLALAAAGHALRVRSRPALPVVLALLALVYTVQSAVPPNLAADSRGYFVFLPSALRHQGVDFSEVLAEWGMGDLPADSPVRRGMHPVGPALVWSPFYGAAHLYVVASRALGRTTYEADGLSAPYLRAAALGTGLVAVLGAALLFAALRTRHARAGAALAVAAGVLASSVPYYVVVQPAMAHGLVFGVAAALVWAVAGAERDPAPRPWIVVGALLGLLVLLRWQAAVAVVLPGAVATRDLRRRRLAPRTVAEAALLAVIVFLPQASVWHAQYGRWITMPQGAGYVDWASPHLLDVLFSADRGLLSWTPVALLGLVGLAAGWRRWGVIAMAGLALAALTAWVNGGVRDWAGSDAFGGRRFDLVWPLLVLGLAVTVEAAATLVSRRPLVAPAAALALLVAWNLGLMALHARGAFPEAAPLDRVAGAQARLLRRGTERVLGALFGARGRHLAYRFFVGEYLYVNANPGGTLAVGDDDARYLGAGWSRPRWHEGGPRFRWALFPEACLRVPLLGPATLPAVLTARAPRRLEGQTFAVAVNGHTVGGGRLGPEWAESSFTLPAEALVAGENEVCFRFAKGSGEEGQQVAAAVARLQLP